MAAMQYTSKSYQEAHQKALEGFSGSTPAEAVQCAEKALKIAPVADAFVVLAHHKAKTLQVRLFHAGNVCMLLQPSVCQAFSFPSCSGV